MWRAFGIGLGACVLAGHAAGQDLRAPMNGNPLVPGYFADPCIRKFGDTYYLYATPDGWGTGEGIPCIWTSKDFVNWTPHLSNWPQTREKWAPSVVKANGKYYMYSSVPCQTWVATAPTPLGPWTPGVPQGPMTYDQTPPGTITLDAEVFQDDDGSAYLAYGTWWTPTIMKLRPDMLGPQGDIIQYFKKPQTTTPMGLIQGCMEAPYMLKRNGIYYLMYSDQFCQNSTYQVKYSTAKTPFGPWTYGKNNPILATNEDHTVEGPGHHGMLADGGRDFIVYHRHAKPFRSQTMFRQVSADVMRFGTVEEILPVKPTHRGVGFLAPSTKRDTNWVVESDRKVTATASSHDGAHYAPGFAADVNNATLWKASSNTYPQWVQFDLGKTRSIKRTEIDFQYPQMTYLYKVSVSNDGKTWKTFADRSNAKTWKHAVDSVSKSIDARYVRVTMLGDLHPNRPNKEIGIWNVKVYDGVNKPFRAPIVRGGADLNLTSDVPRATLRGFVHDSGLPCTSEWRQVSGPGKATLTDATDPETEVAFPVPGRYVLELRGKNRQFESSDRVVVEVKAPSSPLIAAYEFDEAIGEQVRDLSGTAKNGWLASDGDLKTPPNRVSGLKGKGLAFDGSKSYVAVPGLGRYEKFTFATWVKFDRFGNGVLMATRGDGVRIGIDTNRAVSLTVRGNEPETIVSDARLSSKDIGRWVHVAAEFDGIQKRARVSLNGLPGAWKSVANSAFLDLTPGLKIGADSRAHLSGKMDSVRLYRSLLTNADLATLAKRPTQMTVASLSTLPIGSQVELRGVSVTYAPRAGDDTRSTDWFTVTDEASLGRTIVVRGKNGSRDSVEVDLGVTLKGTLRSDAKTGERYIELVGTPEVESAPLVLPRLVRSIREATANRSASLPVSSPVRLNGRVTAIATDRRSMTITDASGASLRVAADGTPVRRAIETGNEVEVVGLVTSAGNEATLFAKSIDRLSPVMDPLTRELIGHFPFDEKAGTVAKSASPEAGEARVIGNADLIEGRIGNAIRLSGDRSTIALPEMGTMRVLTMAAWIKPEVLRPWQAIFHNDGFEPARKLHLSMHEEGHLLLAISGNSPTDVRTVPAFTKGEADTWKHIALVYDSVAGTSRFFVNGELLSEFKYSKANPIAFIGGLKIGSWNGGDRFFKGGIDDFRVYNRALTAEEIRQLAK